MDVSQIFSTFTKLFTQSFRFSLGNFSLPVSYIQAGAVIFLLFILVLSFAQIRRHYVNWSFKGAIFGVFFGFLLALILEGFLIVGGRTAVTEVLGWKNAPKPITHALDAGRAKLVKVLGITDEIPSLFAREDLSSDDAVQILQSLDPTEIKKVKALICTP